MCIWNVLLGIARAPVRWLHKHTIFFMKSGNFHKRIICQYSKGFGVYFMFSVVTTSSSVSIWPLLFIKLQTNCKISPKPDNPKFSPCGLSHYCPQRFCIYTFCIFLITHHHIQRQTTLFTIVWECSISYLVSWDCGNGRSLVGRMGERI